MASHHYNETTNETTLFEDLLYSVNDQMERKIMYALSINLNVELRSVEF